MFASIPRALFVIVLFFTVFAAATTTLTVAPPASTGTPIPANQCNTGKTSCCSSVERSDGSLVGSILALLGVVLEGVEALVGIQCVPIDILGIGQNECHNQPVCCQDLVFNGLIAIGCVPISISL